MKKKTISIILILVIAFSMLPVTSFSAVAAGYEVMLEPTLKVNESELSVNFVPRPFMNGYSIVFENIHIVEEDRITFFAEKSYIVNLHGEKVNLGAYDMIGTYTHTYSFFPIYSPNLNAYYVATGLPSVDEYGYISVYKDGMHGLIDTQGNVVLPCKYAEIYVGGKGLFTVREFGEDTLHSIGQGSPSDDPIFRDYDGIYKAWYGYLFYDYYAYSSAYGASGVAVVKDGSKCGIVDENDNIIVPFIYDDITPCFDDTVWVLSGDKWGIVRLTTGDDVSVTALPTPSKVLVNGQQISFDAYNVNDNNYFKLRDLAYILSGTQVQFEVEWDAANNAIKLTSGKAYTAVGGEMTGKGSGTKTALPTPSKIFLDGKEVTFTAYNIDGNNYFKLRDIGAAFDFGVTWDGATNTIVIDTTIGYTPN